jgi:hypothetical protein
MRALRHWVYDTSFYRIAGWTSFWLLSLCLLNTYPLSLYAE